MEITDLTIVGEVKRNEITGTVPSDSQFAALNPTGKFIQKLYRFIEHKFNDGTTQNIFSYWSENNGWYISSFNVTDFKKLKDQKFLKIID